MSSNQQEFQLTPGLISMIPIFYVGWADTVLSPSEVKFIHQKIKGFDFLTENEKKKIIKWTNPADPPNEKVFRKWVQAMRQSAKNMDLDERISLADLGLEMARFNSREQSGIWKSDDTRKALLDLENALGIEGDENHPILYHKIGNPPKRKFEKPQFSVRTIRDLLDDEYVEARTKLRILLKDPIFEYRYTRDKEVHRKQVLEWCTMLARQGYGALSYPEQYGGQNDIGKYVAIFETLAHHDLSLVVKFGVQFGLFGGAILHLGTKKHHDKYLADIGSLDIPGCFAMTETGHGSNVRGLETTAQYDPLTQEFIIHSPTPDSNKEYIGNALHGRLAVVFAHLVTQGEGHGVHAFITPLRDHEGNVLPGITIHDNGDKMGLNGVDNGKIWFDKVRVPRENLLDKYGQVDKTGNYSSSIQNPSKRFFTMLSTLVGGRISVGRAGLSASKSGLAIAIKYALRRRQFGQGTDQPETLLMDYPTHQWRLFPKLAKVFGLDFALTSLTKEYKEVIGGDMRKVETKAAGLKAIATWHATKTLQECREACGGKGYLYENRFADLKADTEIFTTFEGDNIVLMQLVAKGLLTEFKQQLHDDGYRAILSLVMTKISTRLMDKNPIAIRKTDAKHLLDQEFHRNAFQYRQQKILVTVSQRMRKLIRRRVNPYDAFLRCQTHMVALGHAYVDYLILHEYQKSLSTLDVESPEHKVMKELYDLYALDTIYQNRGWYLEHDYMHGTKTKAIRRMIHKLCRDIRPHAGHLVNAFGISDEILGAEIIKS